MRIIECTQGSPEWLRARAGVITASNFKIARSKTGGLTEQQAKYVSAIKAGRTEGDAMVFAGYKAKPVSETIKRALAGEKVEDFSDVAKKLAFGLAIERLSGEPLDEGFETWQSRRGHALEPEARIEHQAALSIVVRPAGFVVTDDGKFGCSADGFIGEMGPKGGGAEYKCFVSPDSLFPILIDNDWSAITDQVQGCLAITGQGWWDQCLYAPFLRAAGRHFTRARVYPDGDYIDALWKDLWEFDQLVESYVTKLLANPAEMKEAA